MVERELPADGKREQFCCADSSHEPREEAPKQPPAFTRIAFLQQQQRGAGGDQAARRDRVHRNPAMNEAPERRNAEDPSRENDGSDRDRDAAGDERAEARCSKRILLA